MTDLEKLSFALKEEIIALCVRRGLVGFAGTFRTEQNDTITFFAEGPGFRDGVCKEISNLIAGHFDSCGADHISRSEGIYKPPTKKDES
jgi:hypothetical protein